MRLYIRQRWAALALTTEEKSGVEDPVEMERLADGLSAVACLGSGLELLRHFTEACVAREITEELGLTATVGPLLDVWVYRIAPGTDVLVVTAERGEETLQVNVSVSWAIKPAQ